MARNKILFRLLRCIIIIILLILVYFLAFTKMEFDSELWKRNTDFINQRYRMVEDLNENYLKIGMSKDDVLKFLGNSSLVFPIQYFEDILNEEELRNNDKGFALIYGFKKCPLKDEYSIYSVYFYDDKVIDKRIEWSNDE